MFTNYFIKKRIKELAREVGSRPCRSRSLDEARSLLLFYDAEDHEAVMDLLRPLRERGMEIRTCVYVSSKGADLPADDSTVLLREKGDLNAWGFPSDRLLERVSSFRADLLIDITRPGRYASQYIALRHPASFKVGIKYPGQEWYDLCVAVTDKEDIPYLFGQILFYLRSIRAK